MAQLEIDDKTQADIINFGVFHYGNDVMANILNVPQKEIDKWMSDSTGEFYRLYKHGKDTGRYLIDKKLFEKAKSGDLKALQELEYRNQKMK